ncbi:MAG: IclR family transcriptional regulator C-terminal domain-containing protein, partial [Firmicutes bacterium]|nr:IclR family transcriptional regulator C-terminal domain-containing protein [Bacillota bacterium]
GKLFLSQMDEKALDDYIEKSGLKAYTANTITTKDAMLSEFAFLRENGFLYDNEECEPGVRCVAVPVRDFTGRIVAGISISGPAPRLTDDAVARHIGAFKDISSRASEALGYMGQDK